MAAMISCVSDEALRENQIKSVLELEFGPNVNCEIQSEEYNDSILSYPSDSICLQSALKTLECYDVYENNIDTYRQKLLALLNRTDGKVVVSLDTLPGNVQASYKEMINSMRLTLRQFQETSNTIHSYNPHSFTREVITFNVRSNNDTIAYWGVFYFQENKMTNYIVMEKSKAKEVYAVIDCSINKDNTFISRPLSKLGFNIDNESVSLLSEQRESPLFLWDLQAVEPNKINLAEFEKPKMVEEFEPKEVHSTKLIISRNYFDFVIGKTSYSTAMSSVRSKGFKVIDNSWGNEIKSYACVKKFKWNNITWDELDLYFKDNKLVGIAFAIVCNSETKAKHYLEGVSNIYRDKYKSVITDSSPDFLYFDDGETAMEVYGGAVTMYLRICETSVADDL